MSLTNAQYEEIMRSYQEKQRRRRRVIEERQQKIAALAPEFSELDGQIARRSVERARRLLEGEPEALAGMHEEISALSRQKTDLLKSLGLPADYLDPPYCCLDCKDTGYIGNEKCHCFKQASIALLYDRSHLGDNLKSETFSHFRFDYYSEDYIDPNTGISSRAAAGNAYAKCRQFVQSFDTDFRNILLFGDTGLGKTFLSNCIAGELLSLGHSVIYFSANRLFDTLADHAFHRDEPGNAPNEEIYSCDLLIIDDLGTELTNSFTVSQLFVCLNERILRRKSTLISSNLDLKSIASLYSERIFSRITSNYTLLHLFGKDIRLQKGSAPQRKN